VYVEHSDGSVRFRWVKAPTSTELTRLAHTIARRVGCFLERKGLLARDAENSYLTGEAEEGGSMDQLLGPLHYLPHRGRPAGGSQGVQHTNAAA
jgi:Putative transposase